MKRSQNSLSKADTSVRTLAESGILGLVHANSMNAGNITLCDMAKRRKGVLWGESRFGQGLLCKASYPVGRYGIVVLCLRFRRWDILRHDEDLGVIATTRFFGQYQEEFID
jgi:hypothetical protein